MLHCNDHFQPHSFDLFFHFSRSMYSTTTYNSAAGPRAFVPHSAINLSVKSSELAPTPPASLDLSAASAAAAAADNSNYLLAATAAAAAAASYGSSAAAADSATAATSVAATTTAVTATQQQTSSPQILDLTRPVGNIAPVRYWRSKRKALRTNNAGPQITRFFRRCRGPYEHNLVRTTYAYSSNSTPGDFSSPSSSVNAITSKLEQTEPVDFSSNQQLAFARPTFVPPTNPDDGLSRYRSSGEKERLL